MRRYGHAAHRHAAEYHAAAAHHNMAAAAGYGGLLLGRGMHPQYKPVDWAAQHAPHHLDPAACSPYSYPAVPGTYTHTHVPDIKDISITQSQSKRSNATINNRTYFNDKMFS